MRVLRSLVFYAVFYSATAVFVIASVIGMVVLPVERFRRVPNTW